MRNGGHNVGHKTVTMHTFKCAPKKLPGLTARKRHALIFNIHVF